MANGLYIPQSTAEITQQGITGLANIKETKRRGELEERRFTEQKEQQDRQNRFKQGQQRLSTISALLQYADDNKFLSLINEANQVSEGMGMGNFNLDATKALADREGFEKGITTSLKLSGSNKEAGAELFDETIGRYQKDDQPAAEEAFVSPSQRTATERGRRGEVGAGAGLEGERLLSFQESGKVPTSAAGRGIQRITDTKVEKGKKQDYESFDGGITWRKWGDAYSAGKAGGTGGGASDLKWDKDAAGRLDKQYGTLTDTGYVIDADRMAEYQDANTYLRDYKDKGLSPSDAAVLASRRSSAGGIDPIQAVIDQQRGLEKSDREIISLLRKSQFKSVNPRVYGLK